MQRPPSKEVALRHIDNSVNTKELEQERTYKYPEVNAGEGIQHVAMKEKIRKAYYRQIRLMLKSELNAGNRVEAINTLAVPVATYSFNIITGNCLKSRN